MADNSAKVPGQWSTSFAYKMITLAVSPFVIALVIGCYEAATEKSDARKRDEQNEKARKAWLEKHPPMTSSTKVAKTYSSMKVPLDDGTLIKLYTDIPEGTRAIVEGREPGTGNVVVRFPDLKPPLNRLKASVEWRDLDHVSNELPDDLKPPANISFVVNSDIKVYAQAADQGKVLTKLEKDSTFAVKGRSQTPGWLYVEYSSKLKGGKTKTGYGYVPESYIGKKLEGLPVIDGKTSMLAPVGKGALAEAPSVYEHRDPVTGSVRPIYVGANNRPEFGAKRFG